MGFACMGCPAGRSGDVAINKVTVFSLDVGSLAKDRPAVGKRGVSTTAGKRPPTSPSCGRTLVSGKERLTPAVSVKQSQRGCATVGQPQFRHPGSAQLIEVEFEMEVPGAKWVEFEWPVVLVPGPALLILRV